MNRSLKLLWLFWFWQHSALAGETFLWSPQFVGEASSLSLTTSENILPTPEVILSKLNPNYLKFTIRLESGTDKSTGTDHFLYKFYLNSVVIENAYLKLHVRHQELTMMQAVLPEFETVNLSVNPTFNDFNELIADRTLAFTPAEKVFYIKEQIIPAWCSYTYEPSGQKYKIIINAVTGELLEKEPQSFLVAQGSVFSINPNDSSTVIKELPYLKLTGYLEGEKFIVTGSTDQNLRAYKADLQFHFSQDHSEEAIYFDQVQVYYHANRAYQWFNSHFGFEDKGQAVQISTGKTIMGSADNALYEPTDGTNAPAILIGRGEQLTNLARDSDVVIHEYSHHIIYRTLKHATGESGIIHEGTADYFAYAINNDPNLGETVRPGQPYLRTAALNPEMRFDQPTVPKTRHLLGQYWSALLWDLRLKIGTKMDDIVYHAVDYFSARAGFKEALIALLNADRDLNPFAQDHTEFKTFGQNKCVLLNQAIARGFASYLKDINGNSCGLDLHEIAAASDSSQNSGKPKRSSDNFLEGACSVGAIENHSHHNYIVLLLLLCLPVFMVILILNKSRNSHSKRCALIKSTLNRNGPTMSIY